MFSNRFNTKNDPLLEAVKGAMQDGDLRRQAVALVNEAFGVYNRNAIVNEDKADYDAAIEEVYADLKEGVSIDYSSKGNKMGAATDGDSNQVMGGGLSMVPKGDSTKQSTVLPPSDKSTMRVQEGKKLADKDYDKDGKIESPKDEVWGSRLRAAKLAGKLREEEQIDEISKGLLGRYVKGATTDVAMRSSLSGRHSSKAKASKDKASSAIHTKLSNEYDDKSTKRQVGIHKAVNKLTKEERIDEISKKTAMSAYATSRDPDAGDYYRDPDETGDRLKKHIVRKWGKKTGEHAERHASASAYGRSSIGHKKDMSYSTDTLRNDTRFRTQRVTKGGKVHQQDVERTKGDIKRRLGTHTKAKLSEAQMDEAAYSAKAARAGKDIGKPGKMFSKIASKAGKKYGSEERGKKVAGAILAKIRAKHMREQCEE